MSWPGCAGSGGQCRGNKLYPRPAIRRRAVNARHADRDLRRCRVHPRRRLSGKARHRAASREGRRAGSGASSAKCAYSPAPLTTARRRRDGRGEDRRTAALTRPFAARSRGTCGTCRAVGRPALARRTPAKERRTVNHRHARRETLARRVRPCRLLAWNVRRRGKTDASALPPAFNGHGVPSRRRPGKRRLGTRRKGE